MKVIIVGAGVSGSDTGSRVSSARRRSMTWSCTSAMPQPPVAQDYAIGLKGETGLAVLERLGLRVRWSPVARSR